MAYTHETHLELDAAAQTIRAMLPDPGDTRHCWPGEVVIEHDAFTLDVRGHEMIRAGTSVVRIGFGYALTEGALTTIDELVAALGEVRANLVARMIARTKAAAPDSIVPAIPAEQVDGSPNVRDYSNRPED